MQVSSCETHRIVTLSGENKNSWSKSPVQPCHVFNHAHPINIYSFTLSSQTQRITVLSEGAEHWVPQLGQYILRSQIGRLSYPTESEESYSVSSAINVKE